MLVGSVLVLSGLYLLLLAFVFDVSNLRSAVVFKLAPFVLGLALLAIAIINRVSTEQLVDVLSL